MSYGTPLSITLPTIDGVATEAQAATRINDCFNTIKNRLEQKVGPASIDMNADLSFLSGVTYYGPKDMQRANWTNLSAALAAATYPRTCFVLNGDLYYNDDSGNQIRVTASGGVNVSTTGGITGGGYGTGVPTVEINWDSVNNKYKFYGTGTSPNHYAALECDDVILRDGSGNSIRFGAPTGMSADYTALLPGAVPASNSVLVMETGGTISHSTAPAALALVAGGHFTVSGSGRYKHGTFSMPIPAAAGVAVSNCAYNGGAAGVAVSRFAFTGSGTAHFPCPILDGKRILSVDVVSNQTAAGTRTVRLVRNSQVGVSVVSASATNASTTGWASRNFNIADTTITVSTGTYYIEFEGINTDEVSGIIINYDHV